MSVEVVISFPACTMIWQPEHQKCIARFDDGTEAHGTPQDTEEYRRHSAEKSTGDIGLYCWQHDLAHAIVGMMNGGVSRVLWTIAHGGDPTSEECQTEENEAQEFQRRFFLRSK